MDEKQAWLQAALEHLAQTGPFGAETVAYVRAKKTPLRVRTLSKAAGARWYIDGGLALNERYFKPGSTRTDNPRVLSLIVHEVRHLQQGLVTALSVYGELDAWQVDFNFQKSLTGKYPNNDIAALCALPLSMDRAVLREARRLMKAFGGPGYHIELLPLYPLPHELRYWAALPFSKRD